MISHELIPLLERFNATWQQRQRQFTRYSPVPAWSPGVVLTPLVREVYERYLPVNDFCRDLARLAGVLLPGPEWVPALLRTPGLNPLHDGSPGTLSALPDFWHQLPPEYTGRFSFTVDELLPLFCACADLRRFGTGINRYPEQAAQLRSYIRQHPRPCWRLLDLGCGTGAGTRELAALVYQESRTPVLTVGLTREPLEAWMAVQHSRSRHFPAAATAMSQPDDPRVIFLAGEVCHSPCRGKLFDLIAVNGLAGGPDLHQEAILTRFFQELETLLAADGLLVMANHFHDGFLPDLTRLVALARQLGWQTAGNVRGLFLSRFPGISSFH